MPSRRGVLAGALMAPALLRNARAAEWQPTRPVQLLIGFAPGGGADLIARAIAQGAAPLYPQPLVVINKAGAGGAIAAQQAALAAPDGHTLLMGGGSESTSLPAFRELPYDPKRDFRAVIRLMRQRQFILARPDGRFQSMRDAVAAAKADPGSVSHGSSGVGSLPHAMFLMLQKVAGAEFLHAPFSGNAPSLQACLAGQIDLAVGYPEEIQGLVESRELRVLAVGSAERAPQYPDVPTLPELGWPVDIESMKGWVAPAATPPEVRAFHETRFHQAMASPVWQEFQRRTGEPDPYLDGADFQAAQDRLLDQVRAVARSG